MIAVCRLCALMAIFTVSAQGQEFRGFWVDGFNAGFRTTQEVDTLLQRVRAANMNAVIVQMRKRGDAHYPSAYEPPATNQDPNFDALAYLIDRAHNGNPRIEVHVWMNSHTIHPNATPPSDPRHFMNRFPEALTQNNAGSQITDVGYGVDWGHPIANDFTFRVMMDVLRRYDVDGLHYDYIRYTGNTWGYNPTSVARFNQFYNRSGVPTPTDNQWRQWRRDQVTTLVRKVYLHTMAVKPHVKISGALITWGNGPTSDSAWLSSSAYSSVFQDWWGWMQEGILDLAIPMCYYNQNTYPTYYQNWINFTKDRQYGRHAVIGIGNYLNTIANTHTQIDRARDATSSGNRAKGINFFSYAATDSQNGQTVYYNQNFYNALNQKFPSPAPMPAMPWKTNPTTGHLKGVAIKASDMSWVDGAVVALTRPGFTTRTTYTDGTGFYGYADLPPGSYSVTISNSLGTLRVDNVQVAAGQVSTVNFAMGTTGATILTSANAAKNLPIGSDVLLMNQVVTAGTNEFQGRFYTQDQNRAGGIGVVMPNPSLPWITGDLVAARGVLGYDENGELSLLNASVQMLGITASPRPFASTAQEWVAPK